MSNQTDGSNFRTISSDILERVIPDPPRRGTFLDELDLMGDQDGTATTEDILSADPTRLKKLLYLDYNIPIITTMPMPDPHRLRDAFYCTVQETIEKCDRSSNLYLGDWVAIISCGGAIVSGFRKNIVGIIIWSAMAVIGASGLLDRTKKENIQITEIDLTRQLCELPN